MDDEWYIDYPTLPKFMFFLRKKPIKFKISDLDRVEVEEFCLNFTIDHMDQRCPLAQEARNVAEGITSYKDFLLYLFHVFYRTGVVGLKLQTYEKTQWSYEDVETLAAKTLNEDVGAYIHPIFWRVLGIDIRGKK